VIAARQIAAALADHDGKVTAVVVLRRQLLARKPNDLGRGLDRPAFVPSFAATAGSASARAWPRGRIGP